MRTGAKLLSITICLIVVMSCTELVSLSGPETTSQLVVDGSINNLADGNWLRLSTSTPGLDAVGSNTLGQNATVFLVHEDQSYAYEEVQPGNYFLAPELFQGQVGETYHINITTDNKRTYESDKVTIPEPVEITSTRTALVELISETDDGTPFTEYHHDVFIEFANDSKDQFIKIDNRGMAEVFVDYKLTECGLNTELPRGPAAGLNCWSFRDPISRDIQLTNNIGLIKTENYEAMGVRVPFQYRARYVTTLTANNMSINSFNFWRNVERQLRNSGGPFDPPTIPLPGNVQNMEDSDEIVLGYFHAYGTSIAHTCFDRHDVPENAEIPIVPPPCLITCEEFWAPATFEDPDGLEQCQ